jgi:hypothetical protein
MPIHPRYSSKVLTEFSLEQVNVQNGMFSTNLQDAFVQ